MLVNIGNTEPPNMVNLPEPGNAFLFRQFTKAFIPRASHNRDHKYVATCRGHHPVQVKQAVSNIAGRVLQNMTVNDKIKRIGFEFVQFAEVQLSDFTDRSVSVRVQISRNVVI